MLQVLVLFYLFFLLRWMIVFSHSFTYDVLKPQFEKDFNNSCSKYPFVQKHFQRLLNPTGHAVTFVFQQPYLRNGGLGDRIAGLITSAGFAIRFNRALIIRSENGFNRLFRPYIPPQYENQYKNKFDYNRSDLSWAKYNFSFENNDNTELDLYFCINIGGKLANQCSHLWGDPPQPLILVRGNRAYICKWYMSTTEFSCKEEMNREIGIENDNLMEVSGCLLRLVMWPTDFLWKSIDEALESHKLDLIRRNLIKHSHHDNWKRLVSLHFRCGDYGYLRGASYNLACQHSEVISNITIGNETKLEYNMPPHYESGYMGYGTPLEVSRCARKVLNNITMESLEEWQTHFDEQESKSNPRRLLDNNILNEVIQHLEYRTVVHIAADNIGASEQMNQTLNWPNTLMSPSGCHIEMDSSFECLKLTVVYWMIMVLSDYIVTPGHIPNSGFSRYAAVYGLKGDVFRDPKDCENILSMRDLSHRNHNNWNCYS